MSQYRAAAEIAAAWIAVIRVMVTVALWFARQRYHAGSQSIWRCIFSS
jgi:hypothetical protein